MPSKERSAAQPAGLCHPPPSTKCRGSSSDIFVPIGSQARYGHLPLHKDLDGKLKHWKQACSLHIALRGILNAMGFAVRVRSAGQKYGPTCHQRDRADVTEFVTLVRLSSLGQHVGVLALAGYKRRKSAQTAGLIRLPRPKMTWRTRF